MDNREIRSFNFEISADENEQNGKYITGRAIVFGRPADMGWYTEYIDDGALDNTDLRDVRLLVNHDTSIVPLARSRNNNANSTMQLSVIPGEGMDIRANLDTDNNAAAATLYSAVSRGDIDGMSFMFVVDADSWEDLETDHPTRHIRSIKKVLEVSAVTFPVYEQTSLEARGISDALDGARRSLDSVMSERRALDIAKARALAKMNMKR